MSSLFKKYWSEFYNKSNEERSEYFDSLSPRDQDKLIKSFFSEGWDSLIIQNIVDDHLDFIKDTYGIDLINVRIQVVCKHKKVSVNKKAWDHACELIKPYAEYYKSSNIFKELSVSQDADVQSYLIEHLQKRSSYGKKDSQK